MGKNCVIVGCRNKDTNKMEGLKFHRIPKDEPRRSLWLKAINRLCPITGKPWVPSDDGRICSSHFVKEKSDNPSSVDYVPTLKLNSTPMAIPLPDRRKSQTALVTSRVEQVTSEERCNLRWSRWQKFLQSITQFLKTNKHLPDLDQNEVDMVEMWAPNFYIEDGILRQQAKSSLRRFIPIASYVDCVQHISDCHITAETNQSGQRIHLGFEQTLHRAIKKHIWPGAEEDVYDFLKICLACKNSEALNDKQSLFSRLEESSVKDFTNDNLPECFKESKKDKQTHQQRHLSLLFSGLKPVGHTLKSSSSSSASGRSKQQQSQSSTVINLKFKKPTVPTVTTPATSSSSSSSSSSKTSSSSSSKTSSSSSSSKQPSSSSSVQPFISEQRKASSSSSSSLLSSPPPPASSLMMMMKTIQKLQPSSQPSPSSSSSSSGANTMNMKCRNSMSNSTTSSTNTVYIINCSNSNSNTTATEFIEDGLKQRGGHESGVGCVNYSGHSNHNNNNLINNNSNDINNNILSGEYLSSDIQWLANFQLIKSPQNLSVMSNFQIFVANASEVGLYDGFSSSSNVVFTTAAPAAATVAAAFTGDFNKKGRIKMRPVFETLHDLGLSLVKESVYKDLIYSVELAYPPHYVENNIGKTRPIEIAQALDGWKKTRYVLGKLNKHMKSPWIVCSRCVFLATSLYQLSNHQKYGHSYIIGRHDCCLCNFSTKTQSSFYQHMVTTHNISLKYYHYTGNNNSNNNCNNNTYCIQQQYQHTPLISGLNGMYVCQLCPFVTKISSKVTFKNHLESCSRMFKLCTNLFPLARDADIPMMWPVSTAGHVTGPAPGKRKRLECMYSRPEKRLMLCCAEHATAANKSKTAATTISSSTTPANVKQLIKQKLQHHHHHQQQHQPQHQQTIETIKTSDAPSSNDDDRVTVLPTALTITHPSFYHHVCEICCVMLMSGSSLEHHLLTTHNVHLLPGTFDLRPAPNTSSQATGSSSSFSPGKLSSPSQLISMRPFYKCDSCDDYFYSQQGLSHHQTFIHGDEDGDDNDADDENGDDDINSNSGGNLQRNGNDENVGAGDDVPSKRAKLSKNSKSQSPLSSSTTTTTTASIATTRTSAAPPPTTTTCPLCRRTKLQDVVHHLLSHHRVSMSDMFAFKFCAICMQDCHSNRSFECHMLKQHKDFFPNRSALYKAIICGWSNSPSSSNTTSVASSVTMNSNVNGPSNNATTADDDSKAVLAFKQFFSSEFKYNKTSSAGQSAVLSTLIQDKLKDHKCKQKFLRNSFNSSSRSLSNLFSNSASVDCPTCLCQFADGHQLAKHLKQHHREACRQCSARFGSLKHLVKHVAESHFDVETNKCKVCMTVVIPMEKIDGGDDGDDEDKRYHQMMNMLMKHVCFKRDGDDDDQDGDDGVGNERPVNDNTNSVDGASKRKEDNDDNSPSTNGCLVSKDEVLMEISNWKPNLSARSGLQSATSPSKKRDFRSGGAKLANDNKIDSNTPKNYTHDDDDGDDDVMKNIDDAVDNDGGIGDNDIGPSSSLPNRPTD